MGIYYVIGLERKNKKVSGERKMFLLFFILWIAFNAKISLEIILFGIAICGVIFTFLCKCMDYSVRKEITLYKILDTIRVYGDEKLWVSVYENGIKKNIKPRNSLEVQYQEMKDKIH